MAFIRKIKKGGAIYLAKVESYREDGKVKQRVLEYVGKEEGGHPVIKVDLEKIAVSSVKRHLDVKILHQLSVELGLPQMLGKAANPLLAMIYAHLLQKSSIVKLPEWFAHTTIYELLGCDPFSTKELYESLEQIQRIDFDVVEAKLIAFWRSIAPDDDNTVVLDVTDTYFAGSTSESKKRRGKDGHVSRLLQIGLIVSFKNGFPLLHRTFEGNVHNVKVFENMLTYIAANGFKGIIMDRGFFSKEVIADLMALGMLAIVGVKQTEGLQKQFLSQIIRDDIYNKKYQVILKETTVYIQSFEYLGGKLIAIYNPTLEVLKRDKAMAEAKDGIEPDNMKYAGFSLVFHNTTYDDKEVIRKYFEKDIVERAFKSLKGPLSLRPIRVWVRHHVEAHVKICYLAMAILALLDYRSRQIKISAINALKMLQYTYKVNLKHNETKKEWEKLVTMTNKEKELLKILNCSV